MVLGGLQKYSLIDYPESVSCIVYTIGCNMACGYCYNPTLSQPEQPIRTGFTEEMFLEFLDSRIGKIQAVVITGGEPTIHDDLPEFIRKIRERGLKVKLDTQGSRPSMVEKLLDDGLLDYVAMDIKAPLLRYQEVTRSLVSTDDILKSIEIISKKAPAYEFRTTTVRDQLGIEDFEKIGEMIKGAPLFALQKFMPMGRTLDSSFMNRTAYTDEEMGEFKKIMEKYVGKCIVR